MLLLKEGVDLGMPERPAVPQFPPGSLKDAVCVLGSRRALVLSGRESGDQVEGTGHQSSKNYIHLGGLVALSGFQELEEEGTNVRRHAPGCG